VHLDLLDQRPNSRIAGDFRNRRVKHFIRAMEGVSIPSSVCFTLTFQDRMENQNLAGRRALRGQLCSGCLKRLANDDRFRQRRNRNAGDDDTRLGKYFEQTFI